MGRYDAEIDRGLMKYSHKDLTKKDISYLISMYKDLVPNFDNFVFNNGVSQTLLSLTGTIPVNYKGNVYNIPIALWLQESHPFNPPMVYVKPTSMMKIKAGKHVDHTGRVFLPYLTDWKHPASDLLGLVQILVIIFGDECPVFSVRAGGGGAGARPQGNPYPGAQQYPQAGYNPGGMPMPGYPGSNQRMQYPSQGSGYPPSTQPTYPGQQPYNNPYQQQQRQAYPSNQGYPYQQSSSYGGSQQPSYPMQAQAGTQQSSHPPLSSQQSQSLTEEQIKASLLSAVRDKMSRKLEDAYGQAFAEVQSLQKTQDDLNKGKVQLESMLHKMETEQKEVDRNIEILKQKEIELDQSIEKMETETTDFDVDSAVLPTAPLYKQILVSFSEEQALEDAMYYLGDGLRRGVVDIDVFLKNIRELSRRQFLLRALITKCRQKAGLPELT